MITERDEINIRRTAEQKARAEGRKEGLFEVAKKMLSKGVSVSDVVEFTGLTEAEVQALSA